jgi:uncharacterized protein YerC
MKYCRCMRLSKNRLTKAQRDQLILQFTNVLGKLDKPQAYDFYNELFGYEEKEIFAKRLAIILMLHQNRSGYAIANSLKVSEATVAKLAKRYQNNEFKNIVTPLTTNKRNFLDLLTMIDSILTVGGIMPRRNYVIKAKRNTSFK